MVSLPGTQRSLVHTGRYVVLPGTGSSKKPPVAKVRKKRKRKCKKRVYRTGVYVSKKTGQECSFRSGWERKYLEYLDNDPDVITFTYEPFEIPYVSNKKTGRIRKYNPDILVERKSNGMSLEEIKPTNKLDRPTVKKKHAAGERYCEEHEMVFRVITEWELKGLGLI
jgi:hypothetical protein